MLKFLGTEIIIKRILSSLVIDGLTIRGAKYFKKIKWILRHILVN